MEREKSGFPGKSEIFLGAEGGEVDKMKQQESEDLNSQVEPEVAEVEDIEALKQALAEEKKKAEAIWLTGKEPKPTSSTTNDAVSRKRKRLASLPILCLCLTSYLFLMIWNEPLPQLRPRWLNLLG